MDKPRSSSVLITGVSTGIGHHSARAFLARGYQVFGTVRTPADASRLGAELGMHDPQLDTLLRTKLDRIRGSLERALCRAKEAGELDAKTDARALARSITAFAQGAAVVCQVWRDPASVRETLAGARALLGAHRPSSQR